MKINKTALFCAAVLIGFFSLSNALFAQAGPEAKVDIYFFYGDGCPHCADEEVFLKGLLERYPAVNVRGFEVWHNSENAKALAKVGKAMNADVGGVPFTVIGDSYVNGYWDDETSGKAIEDVSKNCLKTKCQDVVGLILGSSKGDLWAKPTAQNKNPPAIKNEPKNAQPIPEKIHFPILGDLTVKNLSLPVLTIVIGALDGFNPCAMWTLVFLISLLLGMANRRRMWILGFAFIAASAAVYFMFMTAWLNLVLFLGFIIWVRIGVGMVALAGGAYNLREYFVNKENVCKVTGNEKRRKVFDKLKELVHKEQFLLALIGIILLAFAVNLVELICSAGFPAVYTQVLAMNHLPTWQYYLYLLLYIFVFMFDDLVVFFIAMITLRLTGITNKYMRASHLIGGVLMLLIGILLIFKPEWLTF